MQQLFNAIIETVKSQFPNQNDIPLHAPVFNGNERKYVMETIDSTFVSSVGAYVDQFEKMMCDVTGASYAIAIVNGTSALHMALLLAGVERDDEVISQSLTFIATCNAISYIGANPLFVDVGLDTLGMCPEALSKFLNEHAETRSDGFAYNKLNGKRIKACVPMHTFGFPCRIDEIADICKQWNIILVEDAAESIGSYYKDKHTGLFGLIGTFSFNGNKTITCGGGGALITDDAAIAKKAKYLTTQAKVPHKWAFFHDEIGYNYRLPNLNAALACAQLEQLPGFIENKRQLAQTYKREFSKLGVKFFEEPAHTKANYWLNVLLLSSIDERDTFLEYANANGVMSRPVWELMHKLPMFKNAYHTNLSNSEWLSERLVNIPSSVRL